MKNFALLGYMASGKSTIAKILAEKLHYNTIDLDQQIEIEEKLSIPEIFDAKGELYFRKREHHILKEILSSAAPTVIALGGGTPCYAGNMDLIKKHNCVTIYLRSSVDNLVSRLQNDQNRPLVSGKSNSELKDFVAMHIFERSFFYNQADIIINTDDKNPQQIAQLILDALA